MSQPKLQQFFESMSAYLSAETDLDSLRQELGELESAEPRYAFYRRLVRGNWDRVLDKMYASTKASLDAHDASGWAHVRNDVAQSHPAQNWDLNGYGEPVRTVLRERIDAGADWPEWLVELADYEWTRYCTRRNPAVFAPDTDAINPTVTSRHYTHDVVTQARQGAQATEPPAPTPRTVLVYRHPTKHHFKVHGPTMGELLAFAIAAGEAGREALQATGTSSSDVEKGAAALQKKGLLGRPALAIISATIAPAEAAS